MANGFGLVSSIVPVLVVQTDANGDPIAPEGSAVPLFKVGVAPYVAPNWPGTAYAITSMFFCNRGQTPANLTVFLVPKDKQYPDSTTTIIKDLNVVGNTGNAPLNTTASNEWLEVIVNGNKKFIPLYS